MWHGHEFLTRGGRFIFTRISFILGVLPRISVLESPSLPELRVKLKRPPLYFSIVSVATWNSDKPRELFYRLSFLIFWFYQPEAKFSWFSKVSQCNTNYAKYGVKVLWGGPIIMNEIMLTISKYKIKSPNCVTYHGTFIFLKPVFASFIISRSSSTSCFSLSISKSNATS